MRRLLLVLALVLCVPALAQTVVNGSFETPSVAGGMYLQYSPAGAGWTFANGAGIQHDGSAFGADDAPDGSQTAFVQSNGTMGQNVTLAAGDHTILLKAAMRGAQINVIKVKLGSTLLGSFNANSNDFVQFALPFHLSAAGTYTLSFNGSTSEDKTIFLDQIDVVDGFVNGPPSDPTPPSNPTPPTSTANLWVPGTQDQSAQFNGGGASATAPGALAYHKNSRATGNDSTAGGAGCRAGGDNSECRGWNNVADGDQSEASGHQSNAYGIIGARVFASGSFVHSGDAGVGTGDAQGMELVLRGFTTDGTPVTLGTNGSPATYSPKHNTNYVPDRAAQTVRGEVVARELGTGVSQGFSFTVLAARAGGVTTVVFVDPVRSSPGPWSVDVVADPNAVAPVIRVTGSTGRNVRWVATTRAAITVEVQ